jgi:hypothetical protein
VGVGHRRWQENSISWAALYDVALKRHRCPLARAPCLNRSSVITSYILLSALFLFVSSEAHRDVMQKEMKSDDQMSGDVGAGGAVSIRYFIAARRPQLNSN